MNEMLLECPSCHATYFSSKHKLVFSLAPQVLKYILDYLKETEPVNRKPLHEVWFSQTYWFGHTTYL